MLKITFDDLVDVIHQSLKYVYTDHQGTIHYHKFINQNITWDTVLFKQTSLEITFDQKTADSIYNDDNDYRMDNYCPGGVTLRDIVNTIFDMINNYLDGNINYFSDLKILARKPSEIVLELICKKL